MGYGSTSLESINQIKSKSFKYGKKIKKSNQKSSNNLNYTDL